MCYLISINYCKLSNLVFRTSQIIIILKQEAKIGGTTKKCGAVDEIAPFLTRALEFQPEKILDKN